MAECDRLLAAAASPGVSSASVTICACHALFAHQGVYAGEIGAPLYALVSLFRFPYRPGAGGWRYAADRVGSWILEEPVHFFDFVMWYFEPLGDPTSVLAVGNSKGRADGMYDDFSTIVRFPRGVYAVITQTLGVRAPSRVEIVAPRARSARGGRLRTHARSSPPTS